MAVERYRESLDDRPRRARPKVLDAPPTVYLGGGAPAPALADADDGGSSTTGKVGVATTAERGEVRALSEVLGDRRVDAALDRDMAEIASQLALRRRVGRATKRGRARPATARFDGSADEIDLDRTLEVLAERRPLTSDELFVRRPIRARRSVALLADVSGSMDGDKARLTAAAIGALVGELIDDELTVIAFWKDLALLRTRATRIDPIALLDDLVRIEPQGLTNVHAAVQLASRELARSPIERRRIVLLSDCVHNAGPDPVEAARAAPPTLVLLEEGGEHDGWMAERIARAGGGRVRRVRKSNEVAVALSSLLGE